ncbi:putative O-methyltransferase [Seiridium cardinale]
MSSPADILSWLQAAGAAYGENKPGAREQLIDLSHALISSLELPSESIQRIGWAEPARAAHCRLGVELRLFEHIKQSGAGGISAKELATKPRTLKHLAATYTVAESGPDTYSSTTLSDALTEPRYRDGIIYTYDVAGPCFRVLPEYLKSINYALQTELHHSSFQLAHKTELPFFAWLASNPPYMEKFSSYMSAYRAGKPSWADPGFYPIADRLTQMFDSKSSEVLLVDVGGGTGHDLKELKEKHPSLPGKLILQDQPDVISTPIKHARAYHLHSVLHDWGDDDCVKILEQLKLALKPGYSTVLLNELIVPSQNAPWPITSMDQLVFVLGSMKERTQKDWEALLKRAGYKIAKVYSYEMGNESLIEAEPV